LMFFAEWKDLNSKNGVLLKSGSGGLSNAVMPRSTVAQSYDDIIGDLDYAVANGPTTNPSYYMNKYAAMILEARVLLTRGQTADVTKALDLANQVISSGKYTLETNVKDIFYTKGLASSEVILGVKPQPLQEGKRENNSGNYYMPFGTWASYAYVARQSFKDLLNGDPRQSWMIGPANTNVQSPNTWVFSKYLPYVGGVASAPTQVSEVSYAMRLSEAYLLKAEALARSGGDLTLAKTQIKTVMARAGVTDFSAVDAAVTPTDVWKQTYYETLRGFTGEDGIDWFALLRFPLATIQQLRPTITSINLLWFGVPVSEFQTNPLFGSQNAGGYPIN
ncbi:MAG: RagB/SusD family nutrient uptake outer membrane protein, partial [Bacteroidetes bacterium]|nr:RagB/SusD family nutrient uptake outer membrane protein [Bacteroidota bacterium]